LKLSPEIYGYHQVSWDGILLSQFLKERYGIGLKPRQCQYLFHELGFPITGTADSNYHHKIVIIQNAGV